ncbi:MAG: uroporphyrinogen-III synthase [Gammaproteobacteria bacterium]|jgi:uroporphyrinogen-III synthase
MPKAKPLAGVTVVVTRPAHQAEGLCRLIETNGGTALRFPVLDIAGPADQTAVAATINRLAAFDIAVFISPNAVQWGLKLIDNWPADIKVAAVGRGSARELTRQGMEPDIFPEQQFNSEALLALEDLQQVAGKRIIIFRGEGGRELLADILRGRGAQVEYLECYRRVRPTIDPALLTVPLQQGTVDILTVTSSEGLENLLAMTGEAVRSVLTQLPLIVVSDRTRERARELGFQAPIILARQASDDALLEAVIDWKTETASSH